MVMIAVIIAAVFSLFSPQIAPGGQIANAQVWDRDGCGGTNTSPALRWSGAPATTRSFALSAFDVDAGSAGWWHWVVFHIGPTWHNLPAAIGPGDGRFQQARNDFGALGYGGPCPPPSASHHYVFTLYALNVAHLHLNATANGKAFAAALRGHVLAAAKLTGIYGR